MLRLVKGLWLPPRFPAAPERGSLCSIKEHVSREDLTEKYSATSLPPEQNSRERDTYERAERLLVRELESSSSLNGRAITLVGFFAASIALLAFFATSWATNRIALESFERTFAQLTFVGSIVCLLCACAVGLVVAYPASKWRADLLSVLIMFRYGVSSANLATAMLNMVDAQRRTNESKAWWTRRQLWLAGFGLVFALVHLVLVIFAGVPGTARSR